MMYSDPETYAFDRPWNRYTTNVHAFHHLHSTYTALQKNNIEVDPTRAANAKKAVENFLISFFDPAHFEVYQEKVDGKQMDFISFRYAASPIAPYEDKQHGGAEIAVLKTLYQSALYPELFKERYVDLVASTIKHRLYKGTDKATGKEIFAATFGREPAMEHAGTRDGLPVNYLWTFKNDPECYDQFEKMYHKKAEDKWNTYVNALILCLDRQNFINE